MKTTERQMIDNLMSEIYNETLRVDSATRMEQKFWKKYQDTQDEDWFEEARDAAERRDTHREKRDNLRRSLYYLRLAVGQKSHVDFNADAPEQEFVTETL